MNDSQPAGSNPQKFIVVSITLDLGKEAIADNNEDTPLDPKHSLRFDYAWKWFNFHAEQRTKMFNFMLLGLGIFATAFVSAFDKGLYVPAFSICAVGFFLCLVFWRIDVRNRNLYQYASEVLRDLEKNNTFGKFDIDKKFENSWAGIATQVDNARNVETSVKGSQSAKKSITHEPGYCRKLWRGNHQATLPAVCFLMMSFFIAGAIWTWISGAKSNLSVAELTTESIKNTMDISKMTNDSVSKLLEVTKNISLQSKSTQSENEKSIAGSATKATTPIK